MEGPSAIVGPKAGGSIDFRGLDPADVMAVATHAMDYKKMLDSTSRLDEKTKADAAQQIFDNGIKSATLKLHQDKLGADLGSQSIGKEYVKDGQRLRDITDGSGKVIRTENLGADIPTSGKENHQLFKDNQGNAHWVKKGDDVPPGWNEVSASSDERLMKLQDVKDKKLAEYEGQLTSLKDSKGNDIKDPNMVSGMMDYYNKNSDAYKFVKITTPPTQVFGKDVPFTGGKVAYKKIPNDPETLSTMPDDIVNQILPDNPKTGKKASMNDVRAVAAKLNISIPEVIRRMQLEK